MVVGSFYCSVLVFFTRKKMPRSFSLAPHHPAMILLCR
jgi:hypothetical protein